MKKIQLLEASCLASFSRYEKYFECSQTIKGIIHLSQLCPLQTTIRAGLTRYLYQYKSATDVTITFMIGFKVLSMKWNPHLSPSMITRIYCHRHMGEPVTIVLLSRLSTKVTPNDLLLFAYISESISAYEMSFILQQMLINTESHNWSICKRKRLYSAQP